MAQIELYPLLVGEADVGEILDVFWSLLKSREIVTVPITCWLLRVNGQPVLVDTGMRSTQRAMEVHKLGPHRMKPEWELTHQLATHNVSPEDVRQVILTHLHYDHAGNCELFPNAEFIIQRRELEAAAAARAPKALDIGGGALFFDRLDVAALVDKLWNRVTLIDGDVELLPGVRLVLFADTHTPGSQAVYVTTSRGTAIILGDIVRNVKLNIEQQIPPGLYYNLLAIMDALEQIKREGDIYLPTHDYAVLKQYPVIR